MPTFSFTQLSGNDILRPGAGANTFYNSVQHIPIPDDSNPWSLDNNKRFSWNQFESSQGVYTFSAFDASIQSCIDKGHQGFNFGVYIVESEVVNGAISVGGGFIGYPMYVHNTMQGENPPDWLYSGESKWIPNWNSNSMLTAFGNVLNAISNHINTASVSGIPIRNIVKAVQILGWGNYNGEWHTSPWRDCGCIPTGTKQTDATLIRFIDMHRTAFTNFPLIIPVNAFESEPSTAVSYYALTASNNWGRIGWKSDHLASTATYYPGYAENNTRVAADGTPLKGLIMNRYKESPITGEPMTSMSEVTLNGVPFGDFERQVRLYGVSQFNNSFPNQPADKTATVIAQQRAASKAAGARIVLTGGSVTTGITPGSQFAITLNWQNIGIAPVYENWNIGFQLKSGSTLIASWASSFVLKRFLPSTSATVITDTLVMPADVASGTYTLNLIITDPLGYRIPFPLWITGRNTDGSYTLSTTVTVGGTTTTTTSSSTSSTSTTSTSTTTQTTTSTTTSSTTSTTKAPVRITAFSVVPSGINNVATWTVVNGPATITLERSSDGLSYSTIFTGNISSTGFTDLNPNATYYYRLRAVGTTATAISNPILITRTPTTTTTSTSTTTAPPTTTTTTTSTTTHTTTSTTTLPPTTTTSTSTTTGTTTSTTTHTTTSTTTRPPTTTTSTTSTSTTTKLPIPPLTTTSTSTTTTTRPPDVTITWTRTYYSRNILYVTITPTMAVKVGIAIYDITGATLLKTTRNLRKGLNRLQFSLSTYRKGLYNIVITVGARTYSGGFYRI